jgi:predicted methyltransferase
LGYRLELTVIRLRDLMRSPAKVLHAVGLRPGMTVLDFGCGPGGFSLAASRLVGPEGLVYAVDIQPLALESVRRAALRRGLGNVRPLPGERVGEVPEASVDVALLYDVLHIRPDAASMRAVLTTIRRALKPAGLLSVSDHHMNGQSLLDAVTGGGLFRLAGKTRRTHEFAAGPA